MTVGESTGRSAEPAQSAPSAQPTPSYEQARDELADVVRRLEAGGVPLEEALALWERGEELADVCEGWLQGARERLAERTRAED